MSDNKEEKKTSGLWRRAVRRVKTLLPAGLIMLSSDVSAHTGASVPHTDTPKQPTTKTFSVKQSADDYLAEVESQLNQYSSKVYKGLKINLGTIKPQDVAHIFESGMNPCITNGNKPLSKASYLGLCQMDLRGTLQKFVKQNADKFPNLQTTVNKHGIRSSAFMNAWKKYSYGSEAKKFEQEQFNFMWDIHYQKIFDNLAATGAFPKITKENYAHDNNLIYSAAVISCANQSPAGTVNIFKQARVALGKNANITDVALKTYDIKTKKWGMKSRYREEKKLLEDLNKYLSLKNLYQSLKLKNSMTSFSDYKPAPIHTDITAELNSRKITAKNLEETSAPKPTVARQKEQSGKNQALNLAMLREKKSRGLG